MGNNEWQRAIKLAEKYTNIRAIKLIYTEINEIKKEDLNKFPKLEYLNLKRNRLDAESIREIS